MGTTRNNKDCQQCVRYGRDCGTCKPPTEAAAGLGGAVGVAGDVRVSFDDPNVAVIGDCFASAGESAWPVGGCVRDSLLGRAPKDIDFACSTSPEQTAQLLAPLGKVTEVGSEYGTVAVRIGDMDYELTTLRGETYAPGSRLPEVVFGADLADDLARRDFTIGAMAVGSDGELIDPFGGYSDLVEGVIRCVGNPAERFEEDPLRVLRGIRFASLEPRTIDAATLEGMRTAASTVATVSRERIAAEVRRVISSADPEAFGRLTSWTSAINANQEVFGADVNGLDYTACVSSRSRFAALASQGVNLMDRRFSKAESDGASRVVQAARTSRSETNRAVRTT